MMGLGFGFGFIFLIIGLIFIESRYGAILILYFFFGFLIGYLKYLLEDLIRENKYIKWELDKITKELEKVKPTQETETEIEIKEDKPKSQIEPSAFPDNDEAEKIIPSTTKPKYPNPLSRPKPKYTKQDLILEPRLESEPEPEKPSILTLLFEKAWAWLNDGNLFVRIGIILFFLGTSFLIKLGIDNQVISIELRLAGLSIGAIGLLIFGWKQRLLRPKYALLLQGGAIGTLYLIIFGAFRMYQLLPSSMAFALLFVVSMLTAALAILQEARSLAFFGFLGGFIAPILTSTGNGNHVALFSYYAILNTAILVVAWFRSWRLLNLLGFFCTYVIGITWGVLKYNPSHFATTEPFVILFFIFYITIAVLYAIKQPPKLQGYVDTTLLFGVPAITFGIQIALVKQFEYGIAISAFCFGLIYIGIGKLIWSKGGQGFKLLAQVFLALALVFTSLAIPFAFDAKTTAGAWALEGAVVFWVGCQQNRLFSLVFGAILQFGAGLFLLHGMPYKEPFIFLNANYIGVLMIVIAGLISLYHLYQQQTKYPLFNEFIPAMHVWIASWWILGGTYQLVHHLNSQQMPFGFIAYSALTLLLLSIMVERFANNRTGWGGWYVKTMLSVFPIIWIGTAFMFVYDHHYPFDKNGIYTLLLAFISGYSLVFYYDKIKELKGALNWAHFVLVSGLFFMIEWQWFWWCKYTWKLEHGWLWSGFILPFIGGLSLLIKSAFWPLNRWKSVYLVTFGQILVLAVIVWMFASFSSSGRATPLPWIPLINPLDILSLISAFILYQWGLTMVIAADISFQWYKKQLIYILALFLFIGANITLLRMLHYSIDVPYTAYALFHSHAVQTWLSVFWTLSGVFFILYANPRQSRLLWIAGAALLALVVGKLFIIDLAARGSVERIISFMFVGMALMGIGYFAPMPPAKEKEE